MLSTWLPEQLGCNSLHLLPGGMSDETRATFLKHWDILPPKKPPELEKSLGAGAKDKTSASNSMILFTSFSLLDSHLVEHLKNTWPERCNIATSPLSTYFYRSEMLRNWSQCTACFICWAVWPEKSILQFHLFNLLGGQDTWPKWYRLPNWRCIESQCGWDRVWVSLLASIVSFIPSIIKHRGIVPLMFANKSWIEAEVLFPSRHENVPGAFHILWPLILGPQHHEVMVPCNLSDRNLS